MDAGPDVEALRKSISLLERETAALLNLCVFDASMCEDDFPDDAPKWAGIDFAVADQLPVKRFATREAAEAFVVEFALRALAGREEFERDRAEGKPPF